MYRYVDKSTRKVTGSANSEISRIISAAVVNKRFCKALLADPSSAISQGFFGEPFQLSLEQREQIAGIKENSLKSFAAQLANL